MMFKRFISLILIILLGSICIAQDIAVLSGRERKGSADQQELNLASRHIREALQFLEIPFRNLSDASLKEKDLKELKLLFLPQNHILSAENFSIIKNFVEKGGKIAVFYSSDKQLLNLLDIKETRYVSKQQLGNVSGISFIKDIWQGVPEFLPQRSGNLLEAVFDKENKNLQIAGNFIREDGSDSDRVGLLLHDNGFYMAHVYLAQDRQDARQFLQSIIAHFVPEYWKKATKSKLTEIGKIFTFENLEDFSEWYKLSKLADDSALEEVQANVKRAEAFLETEDFVAAYKAAQLAWSKFRLLFVESCPSKDGELRGVWIHSPYGIADWGWDKTIKVLADNGFNAIFPNFLWGYNADYPSEVLPNHPTVDGKDGKIDFLQQCLNACKKYKVEMHVWKVNWNMGHRSSEDMKKRMRVLGRTQVTFNGNDTDYLAPHNPDNLALEVAAMLEIVRKYPVDGIHFDYIRYPGGNTDFSFDARIAFEKYLGRPVQNWPQDCYSPGVDAKTFTLWRRQNITRLVREVSREAKKIRPDIKISAAVYGDWEGARNSVAQDAAEWINEGLLDFVCPMNYSSSVEEFIFLLDKQLKTVKNRIPVYPGIGSYLLTDAAALSEQIMQSRMLGADGFISFQHTKDFAENFLPYLGKGPSSQAVTQPLPHHSEVLRGSMRSSLSALPEGCYSLSESIVAEFILPFNLDPSSMKPSLLRNGWELAEDVKLTYQREGQVLSCRMDIARPGNYRLQLSGEDELGMPILSRGENFRVLSAVEEKEVLRMEGLPEFADNQLPKVAVWQHNSYGSDSILSFLQEQETLNVAPLYNINPATLAACDVIIIPQPKNKAELFKTDETASLFREFISNGGGLFLTHSMIGSRGFLNPLSEMQNIVIDQAITDNRWKKCAEHEITAEIADEIFQSTYPFVIAMKPSEMFEPIACVESGQIVIAAAKHGEGRLIACGLALGIERGEASCELKDEEKILLLNSVFWLNQGNRD